MEQETSDPTKGMHAFEVTNQQDAEPFGPDHLKLGATELNKIKDLPKEVGVMLMTAGLVGFILPGPGVPAIIAGGLVLWPNAFGKLESWLEQAHPRVHQKGMQQINRFLNDLNKRYPDSHHEQE